MNPTQRTRLMHAALDGEATSEETRDLERVLAADPSARSEYDELRRLFDALSRVPKAFPPEGLVASVMARVPQPGSGQSRLRQLFNRPGVIGLRSNEAPGSSQGTSPRVHRVSPQGPHFRSENMSEDKNGFFGKRKVWIGGGIAAAAVILAVSSGVEFPPFNKDTVGTIVPAQRFRADQPATSGVAGGGQSGTGSTQGNAPGNVGDVDGRRPSDRQADRRWPQAAMQGRRWQADRRWRGRHARGRRWQPAMTDVDAKADDVDGQQTVDGRRCQQPRWPRSASQTVDGKQTVDAQRRDDVDGKQPSMATVDGQARRVDGTADRRWPADRRLATPDRRWQADQSMASRPVDQGRRADRGATGKQTVDGKPSTGGELSDGRGSGSSSPPVAIRT